jgi:lipopolysaccharide export system protein LptA
MNLKKLFLAWLLSATGAIVWAQTNQPAAKPGEQGVLIHSDSGYFDGLANQMVYLGHVMVTDHLRVTLNCERLTVDVPKGGDPTNVVAETNVVIDLIDEQGQTNHVTAEKAVYAYLVVDSVTNQTVTFTGGNPTPKVDNPRAIITGEPLFYNVRTKKFDGKDFSMLIKPQPGSGGTNGASPFNLLK